MGQGWPCSLCLGVELPKLPPCALQNPSASAHLAGIAHLLLAETRCLHVLQCQALGVS